MNGNFRIYLLRCCRTFLFKKNTRADAKRDGHSRKIIGEAALSKTYFDMSKRDGKRKQRYVDHPRDRLKLTYLIHGPGHSSDKCKVLNYCGSKYTECRPSKECRKEPNSGKIGKQQEKNYMVQHEVYEIILQEKEKLSVKY